jgi:hypothetical protein
MPGDIPVAAEKASHGYTHIQMRHPDEIDLPRRGWDS